MGLPAVAALASMMFACGCMGFLLGRRALHGTTKENETKRNWLEDHPR